MINVNGSGVFNNQNNINSSTDSPAASVRNSSEASAANAVSKAVADIRSLMAGDAFTGQITQLDGNRVMITLPNGAQLSATLQNNQSITTGQNLTFVVQENNANTILLKPMQFVQEQKSYVAGKALEAAGLADNPANQEIVQELLNHNMSVSSQTLNDMARAAVRYPQANPDTLVRLYKLDIPITQDNIQQFEAYKSYENSISGEIMNLASEFAGVLADKSDVDGIGTAARMLTQIMEVLYDNSSDDNMVQNSDSLIHKEAGTEGGLPDRLPSDAAEPLSKFLDETSRGSMAQKLTDAFGNRSAYISGKLMDENVTAKEILQDISRLLESGSPDLHAAKELLKSDEFSKLMEIMMRDTMHMSPKDVKEKDSIKDFYKRVRESADKLSKAFDEQTGKDSAVSKSLNNIRSNIDFMNDLNKNMTFFQMPIKFSENNANGELYVFTNKKSLKQHKDNISALLHLDMDNLGPMDIYVKMAGKNVSTNFCLESEEMLDFIYSHIDRLNDRLKELGYDCHFEMKVKEETEEHIDFVEDFLDFEQPKLKPVTQLVFDQKA